MCPCGKKKAALCWLLYQKKIKNHSLEGQLCLNPNTHIMYYILLHILRTLVLFIHHKRRKLLNLVAVSLTVTHVGAILIVCDQYFRAKQI